MMEAIARRAWPYIWVVLCALHAGTVVAEGPDDSVRGRVENHSYMTRCAEADNINIPFYAQRVTAFRLTATHPTYNPPPIIDAIDFSHCSFAETRLWTIGRQDGASAEFRRVGDMNSHIFFAADRPPAGNDMKSSVFPRAIGAGTVTDQFIRFTADEDSDVNIELKIGADLHVHMAALEGNTDTRKLTLRCMTWDGSGWQNRGDRTFTPDRMAHVWSVPDLTWIEGADANIIHLRVVTAEEGGETSPSTRGLYDYVELKRRDMLGETKLPPLIRNNFIEVVPIHVDFWWRYPESMTVQVVGGAVATDVHYVRILKSAPGSNPPDVDEIFVLYEDGNARIVPLPPSSGNIAYGASIILGPSTDAKRPTAPIDRIVVDPRDLALEVYHEGGTVSHLELWADRTQTVVDVTQRASTAQDVPLARLRSMWVYDGQADTDRIGGADGAFPLLHPWRSFHGSWWQFVKTVPSYHTTYSPDFRVEILDPSPAYLIWEAEDLYESRGVQPQVNPAASASQVLRVSPHGGEAIYRINLERSQPATQMRIRYADQDGGGFSRHRGNQLRVVVDGKLEVSTYTTDTGGWDAFERAPGLFLGDLAPGEHTLKVIIGPGTQGVQLDRFELVSQPMVQRQIQPVLSMQAEDLSAGQGFNQEAHPRASGQNMIHMGATGGMAIFRVDIPVSLAETYLTVRYLDDVGPNHVQVFVDGQIAAKFPTSSTAGQQDFIASPELFIGQLSAGKHEIQFITSPGTWGVGFDEFSIFTRDSK